MEARLRSFGRFLRPQSIIPPSSPSVDSILVVGGGEGWWAFPSVQLRGLFNVCTALRAHAPPRGYTPPWTMDTGDRPCWAGSGWVRRAVLRRKGAKLGKSTYPAIDSRGGEMFQDSRGRKP